MNVQQSPCVIKAKTEVGQLEVVEVVSNFHGTPPVPAPSAAAVTSSLPPAMSAATTAREVPDYIKKLVEDVDAATPESAVDGLKQLLIANRHIFSENEADLGRTNVVHHRSTLEMQGQFGNHFAGFHQHMSRLFQNMSTLC